MKKVDSLLRKEVTILGANGLFGKITSLLLKESSSVNVLNLFDYTNIQTGDDLKSTKSNCIVKCHSGKESIRDALKSAEIIVVSDDISRGSLLINSQAEFLYKAPKIVDYAAKIAGYNSSAIIVVATSPINFTLPLMNTVLDKLGKLNVRKVLGMTNVDIIRANSLFAAHLHVNPKKVWLPVVGGSSQETRVPLFSKARPPQTMNLGMWQKITSEIKRFDLQISGALCETEMINRAHATAQLICAVMAGLEGKKGVVETVMSQQELVKGAKFFSLPVLLGEEGIQKRISLPSVTSYESNLLSHAIKSLASDASKAVEYLKTNVNLEDLKMNSRINKLNDLEVVIRTNTEVKSDNDTIHKTSKIKEKCHLSIKNVFSKNAEVEHVMKERKILAQNKVSCNQIIPNEMKYPANFSKTQIIEEAESLLTNTPPSEIFKIKSNKSSVKNSSIPDRNNNYEHLESKTMKEGYSSTDIKSGQDTEKAEEGFEVDSLLNTGCAKEGTILNQSESISRNINRDNKKPVFYSAVSNTSSLRNKISTGNETSNIENAISSGHHNSDSVIREKQKPIIENLKGYQKPELKTPSTAGVTNKFHVDSELPPMQQEGSISRNKYKIFGRIPPPQPEIQENKEIIDIITQENDTRNKNRSPYISNDLNPYRVPEAGVLFDHSEKTKLNQSFLDVNNEEPSSTIHKDSIIKAPSKEQKSSFLTYRDISEDSVKENMSEFVILYPPMPDIKDSSARNDNGIIEKEIQKKGEITLKKKETETVSQPQSISDEANKDSKTFQSKSSKSEGKNLFLPVLKEELVNSTKKVEQNEKNIRLSEIKDKFLTNEKIHCQNKSFDKNELSNCISISSSTDSNRLDLSCKNVIGNVKLFENLKDKFSYFPITECARFMSSESLSKEANDINDNADKKKYKPEAQQIWKFFKDKRNFIRNEKLVPQEGPAATLLKKKNSPLANVKLAHELRHINNDEPSLTRKLHVKQKKLIMTLRNSNVSFDKEKAEIPLSIKTNSGNFKIKPNVQPSNFLKSSDSQQKTQMKSTQEFSKNSLPMDKENVKNIKEMKKAKSKSSNDNFMGEDKDLAHAVKKNDVMEKKEKQIERSEVDKKQCSAENKTPHYIQHTDVDLKQYSTEAEKHLNNTSMATTNTSSKNNQDLNIIRKDKNKTEEIRATADGSSEMNRRLPATVLDSSQHNREEEQNQNNSNSISTKQINLKKDNALVIVNVSPDSCELSKIKC